MFAGNFPFLKEKKKGKYILLLMLWVYLFLTAYKMPGS